MDAPPTYLLVAFADVLVDNGEVGVHLSKRLHEIGKQYVVASSLSLVASRLVFPNNERFIQRGVSEVSTYKDMSSL